MRRIAVLIIGLLVFPAVSASATSLGELLEKSRETTYSAEQMVGCSTPDGFRGARSRIKQVGAAIKISPKEGTGHEVTVGSGAWAYTHQDRILVEAGVDRTMKTVDSRYSVQPMGQRWFMGREATGFEIIRDGTLRVEMVFDEETGALVRSVTYDDEGFPYCWRRFMTFEPSVENSGAFSAGSDVERQLERHAAASKLEVMNVLNDEDLTVPETVAGFTLLDRYADEGVRLNYYSDGFFSFAVFETKTRVELPDAVDVDVAARPYQRVFTAGQVSYSWEVDGAGMAMVGDLPPDLHEEVLRELPQPDRPNVFTRLWRSLFGR